MNETTVTFTSSEISQLLKSVGYSLTVYQRQVTEFGNQRSKASATELLEIRSKLETAAMGGD